MQRHKMFLVLLAVLDLTACGVVNPSTFATTVPSDPGSSVPSETELPKPSDTLTPTTLPPSPPTVSISTTGQVTSGGGIICSGGTVGTEVSPTPLHGHATITDKDNQQTLYLAVGETLTLDLSAPLIWEVQIGDQHIIGRVPDANPPASMPQHFKALASGQTTLSAIGDLPCRRSQPACMTPSLLFHLTLVVK